MTLEALGIVATGLLAAWVVGGVLLRVGGLVLVLVGLSGLALFGQASAALIAAIGALLWLTGHWHYALRHQHYKSPLARRLFCCSAPAWLDPTRERFESARPDRDEWNP